MSRSLACRCRIAASDDFKPAFGKGDVGLQADHLGPVRRDLRLGRGEVGPLDVELGSGLFEGILRSDRAGGQLGLPLQVALRLRELRPGAVALGHPVGGLRLGALERRARLVDLGALGVALGPRLGEIRQRGVAAGLDLLRIEARHHLAFLHGRVVVGEDLDHLAGQLRADENRRHGVQGAGGANARRDGAAVDGGEPVGRVGRAAAGRAPQDKACRLRPRPETRTPTTRRAAPDDPFHTARFMPGIVTEFAAGVRVNSLSCCRSGTRRYDRWAIRSRRVVMVEASATPSTRSGRKWRWKAATTFSVFSSKTPVILRP